MQRNFDKDAIGNFKMVLGTESLNDTNIEIVHHALKCGINAFDTADCYGNGTSETALGQIFPHLQRQSFFIASKCGVNFGADGSVSTNGSRDYILHACEESLRRLQIDYIDLYYLHRTGQNARIEESMLALKELVQENKIKYIGLSEVTAEQIRRAHQIHPVAAVQIEYSPWSRQDEYNDVIKTCRELNITVMGYSPLGRGFFTAENETFFQNLGERDYRKLLPRYNDTFLTDNLAERAAIDAFANRKGCSTAQLVLAWELSKNIVPVFGTTNAAHFDENVQALSVKLSSDDLVELDTIIQSFNANGERYPSKEVSGIFPEPNENFSSDMNALSITRTVSKSGIFACPRTPQQITSAPLQSHAEIVSANFGRSK